MAQQQPHNPGHRVGVLQWNADGALGVVDSVGLSKLSCASGFDKRMVQSSAAISVGQVWACPRLQQHHDATVLGSMCVPVIIRVQVSECGKQGWVCPRLQQHHEAARMVPFVYLQGLSSETGLCHGAWKNLQGFATACSIITRLLVLVPRACLRMRDVVSECRKRG